MSKIAKVLFHFVFDGWSSLIIVSIIYAFILGGIASLILGTPSGITVGIIAFFHGLKKGRELEKQNELNRKRLELVMNSASDNKTGYKTQLETIQHTSKKRNDQIEVVGETKTKTIDSQESHNILNQQIHLDEAQYLLEGYRLVKVKEGGMGKVFICEADHFKDEEYVAIKVMKGFSSFNLDRIKNWLYECHSWVMLGKHPNIVQIKLIHYGIDSPQIVMEYVENNLEELQGSVIGDAQKIVNIGINICDALIHASNIIPNFVHLDLKPQNILITKKHQAKVTDFGIIHSEQKTSQLEELKFKTRNFPLNKIHKKDYSQPKKRRGTFFYMSPEQIRISDEIDSRSDMYSLGCIFYELLTGEKLFEAANKDEYFRCHLEEIPPSIKNADNKIPTELLDVTFKCLAKRKQDRFNSFSDLRTELANICKTYFNEEPPEIVKYTPNEEVIISIVEGLIKLGDYERARLYSKSIAKNIFWKNFFPALCDSYEKKYDSSLHQFKSCIQYISTKFEKIVLYKELGYAVEKTGELNEALSYYKIVAELNPELGSIFADIARIKLKNKKYDEAIKNYKHSLELSYDPGVVAKYLEFLIDIKHFDVAIKEAQKALLMYNDDMQVHIYLAQAAISKLVESITNNIPITDIRKYLSLANKHASIALNSGFQVDKAEDILELYHMFNKKIT